MTSDEIFSIIPPGLRSHPNKIDKAFFAWIRPCCHMYGKARKKVKVSLWKMVYQFLQTNFVLDFMLRSVWNAFGKKWKRRFALVLSNRLLKVHSGHCLVSPMWRGLCICSGWQSGLNLCFITWGASLNAIARWSFSLADTLQLKSQIFGTKRGIWESSCDGVLGFFGLHIALIWRLFQIGLSLPIHKLPAYCKRDSDTLLIGSAFDALWESIWKTYTQVVEELRTLLTLAFRRRLYFQPCLWRGFISNDCFCEAV